MSACSNLVGRGINERVPSSHFFWGVADGVLFGVPGWWVGGWLGAMIYLQERRGEYLI